ncbi:MAG: hypothetical protein LLG44_05685 [Chloroflexi bacterium]|nr:hypothetical protein [Chloroflexota bacterium]
MNLTGVNQITAWGFYLRVGTETELQELLAVRPEYVCRGFMDWGWPNEDYRQMRWVVECAHAADIRFEGGISYSPVLPPAGAMSSEQYADLTTCNPRGAYTPPADNAVYRQGAIHNPATREWFLDMARAQLDMGVDGVHIDEIECHYPWRGLGFDQYATNAFREWLIGRYALRGWQPDDPRWQSELGVDLTLYQGSMLHFDFLRHLEAKGLLEDAASAQNTMEHVYRFMREDPIGAMWGNPWFERYAGTFQFDMIERYWGEALIALKEYAAQYGRQVIVNENMNGCARPFADYTMAHGGLSYHNPENKFDLSLSCAQRIRQVKAESLRRAGSVPVVFFLDWGHAGSDMDAIPPALRRTYVSKLAAETAAEGTFFALPINGEGYNAVQMGYQGACIALAAFYREHKRLFLAAPVWDIPPHSSAQLTVRGYQHEGYRVLHCVNHRVDSAGDLALRRDAAVILPADSPRAVRAYSAEWQGGRAVAQHELPDGTLQIELPPSQVYCALELRGA